LKDQIYLAADMIGANLVVLAGQAKQASPVRFFLGNWQAK